jgi:RNA polymerase sigma-70 factor (ECF subfamily)
MLASEPSAVVVELLRERREAPARPTGLEESALRGDRDAWNELIRRHERRVVLSLVAAGVPPAQAREFAQDAWLRLINQSAQGKVQFLQLPGLVVRQALFLARSARRKLEGSQPEPDAAVDSAEVLYLTRERLARARTLVERLNPSARAVFALLYGEPQLPHSEIAARVGLSVQRVRQIICEVRKVLRVELEEADVSPHP